MKISYHAKVRGQQRGIPIIGVELIKKYGRYEIAPGGATKVLLGKREANKVCQDCKKTIQSLDKLSGVSMIIKDDNIITIYK